MEQLITCGINTQLHSFPNLTTKATHEHYNNEINDLQLFNGKKLFVEINKNWGIEFLRIKNINGNDKISLVKKMRMNSLQSVACPKSSYDEIAVGFTTGQIRVLNYKTCENVKTFNSEFNKSGVSFLDYSLCDEYLSSVYENGIINIFGLKTGIKMEKLKLDKNSTIARFHPKKRFNLSIGSYNGSVKVYDLDKNQIIFNQIDAHKTLCTDVCMSKIHSDLLLTVGYDTVINIFDIRKKKICTKINSSNAITTIDLSDCGKYCAIGTLHGEVLVYDFRNLDNVCNTYKISDTIINRVNFINVNNDRMSILLNDESIKTCYNATQTTAPQAGTSTKSVNTGDDDSFNEMFDLILNHKNEDSLTRLKTGNITRRSSFFEDLITKKCNDFSFVDKKKSVRLSSSSNNEYPKKQTFSQDNLMVDSNNSMHLSPLKNSFRPNQKASTPNTDSDALAVCNFNSPNNVNNVVIARDKSERPSDSFKSNDIIDGSDKKELPLILTNDDIINKLNIININVTNNFNQLNEKYDKLLDVMKNLFQNTETNILFNNDFNKQQIVSNTFNLLYNQNDVLNNIQMNTTTLLNNNHYYNKCVQLKNENEELKRKLHDLSMQK